MTCPPIDKLLGELDADIEAHIDACAACRQAVSALARDDAPAPSFGRYRLDTVIGSGGMGIVYRAWDPELARAVAIKVVKRAGEDAAASARLAREAQSLARLSHRHVCQVYDVGTEGVEVWVAMELIDGWTLRNWAGGRPRAALLDVLLAAAQGLAAAHAAGVIHRDVKPENVLVARDGRAVVTDFGLARIEADGGEPASGAAPNVTAAGAIAGTPAYLAPEQLARAPVDARVDQFAWAVMAWELLLGKRPFPAELEARADAVRGGIAPSPGLPRGLGAALVRALAADPAARFPTMDDLVAAIRGSQRRVRTIRRYVATGAAAIVLAGGAFVVRGMGRADPAAACERTAGRADTVWNAKRSEALQRAFIATGKPFAADSGARVSAVFDDFAQRFGTEAVDACRATFARGEASQKVFDLRKACLDHGLDRLAKLLTVFEHPDGEIVTHAVNAAYAVAELDACRDVPLMLARQDEPTDPRARVQLAALQSKLAQADAIDDAGDAKQSSAIAREIAPAVDALGYQPLIAEVAYRIGVELRSVGTDDEAETALQRAVTAAEAGRDDVRAAQAWIRLASVARAKNAYDESARRFEQAAAKLTRVGNPPELFGFFLGSRGDLEHTRGDLVAARADYEHALTVLEPLGGERPRVATTLANLATLYGKLGLQDLRLRTAERAAALAEKLRGPNHPLTADALLALGSAQGHAGQLAQAVATLERALAIRMAVYGPDSDQVVASLNDLAGQLAASNDMAGAEAKMTQAIAIRTRLHGAESVLTASLEANLGHLLAMSRPKEALAHLEHALAVESRVHGENSVEVAGLYVQIGTAQTRLGAHADARKSFEHARDIFIAKLGADHPRVAMAYSYLGRLALDDHDTAGAIAGLDGAVAIADKGQRDAGDAADDRFELAKLLWPTQRARAHAIAIAARDGFAKIDGAKARVTELDAWLAAH